MSTVPGNVLVTWLDGKAYVAAVELTRLQDQRDSLLAALEALYNDCYLTGPVDTVAQARAAIKGAKQ